MKMTISRQEVLNHNLTRVVLALALLATPFTAFAYTQTLSDLSILAVKYFNQAIYLIVALAVLVFVWNVYRYFFKADPENKKEAGLYVMYSVIGFFVIIAFWGLVNIVSNTLNLNTQAPSLNFFSSSIGGGSNGSPVSNQYSAPIGPTTNGGFYPGAGTPTTGGGSNGAGTPTTGGFPAGAGTPTTSN